ncbi:hypothetical protein HNQ56_000352 [Anaerotaenia torta]|uniref:YjfB family protein n=1 Tax=Anaerotaenia torta TaxID=433293 RepID=UPI003D1AFD30
MTINSMAPASAAVSAGNATISTAVLAKSLDTFEQTGESLIKMMELSVNPHIGGNFDMLV